MNEKVGKQQPHIDMVIEKSFKLQTHKQESFEKTANLQMFI